MKIKEVKRVREQRTEEQLQPGGARPVSTGMRSGEIKHSAESRSDSITPSAPADCVAPPPLLNGSELGRGYTITATIGLCCVARQTIWSAAAVRRQGSETWLSYGRWTSPRLNKGLGVAIAHMWSCCGRCIFITASVSMSKDVNCPIQIEPGKSSIVLHPLAPITESL